MKLQNCSVFLNVAKYGSISQAARIEHLTQPAVTAIISSLEKELGVALFHREMRQRKPIELTKEGQVFKKYAMQILDLYSRMELELAENTAEAAGFSIGSGRSNSVFLLPALLERYKKQYPATNITVKTYADTYLLHNKISSGECDIGFSSFAPDQPGFVVQQVMDDPFVLVCPADMKINDVITFHQFRKLPLIIREVNCSSYERLVNKLAQRGLNLNDLNVVRQVYDNAAVRQAIGLGMGCGFVTRSLVSNNLIRFSDCKVVQIKDFEIERQLYLVRNENAAFTSAMKSFWLFTCNSEWYRDILPGSAAI